jgi:nucleotide-binding universal stress UspA family protein
MDTQKTTSSGAYKAANKPKKILVPTDFSENSKQALPYALQYAEQFGAQLYLINIIEPVPWMSDMRDVPLTLSENEIALQTKADLEALASESLKGSKPVETVARKGKQAYAEIVSFAREMSIDLIIIATHGRTGLKRTFLGSTSERVVRHASCPVMVVRQPEEIPEAI